MINVAGVMRRGNLLEATAADLRDTLAVHVAGAFNTSRAALRHWSAAPGDGRRLVNISSASTASRTTSFTPRPKRPWQA